MTNNHLPNMKALVDAKPAGQLVYPNLARYRAFRRHFADPIPLAKADAVAYMLANYPAYVDEYDRIAGSLRGAYVPDAEIDPVELNRANDICASYGSLSFHTNSDHFAPGYERFLKDGIDGTRARIAQSRRAHENDPDDPELKHPASGKAAYLDTMETVLDGFAALVENHAKAAKEAAEAAADPDNAAYLRALSEDLTYITHAAPATFRQALNLVWLCHVAFVLQGKYAQALGRMDQYLYPYYRHDIDAGLLTEEMAEELVACTFIKIKERRWTSGDDVVNICIGGVKPDGSEGINELSYVILHSVRDCNIPGPNLSARLHTGMPDKFLDECLQVIGTGLGYPALMNDLVNIPALHRHGYSLEDARDYCFVGCIENFIPGRQPAWSDGRFNVPEFLEGVFYRGRSNIDTHYCGVDTGDLETLDTMEKFMDAFDTQLTLAAAEYVAIFNNTNDSINRKNFTDPFMSLFCEDCIGRAMDINDGGAKYPSCHGAVAMGIATVADSLAAIEKTVYHDHTCTLTELRDAMQADFAGYEVLQAKLIACPKYGNDDNFVDKYAIWYVKRLDELFAPFRTRDGGPFYTAIASNTQSVYAGMGIGATPDGRHAKVPLSDAASPTYGMDKNGPTATFLSMCKPDYRLVSCGTVLNQKYTPDMLRDPVKRQALISAIEVYFDRGGQEVQINCVSKEMLRDAMAHPEKYQNLVVRVSGFSAYFTSLDRAVQEDILHRTEHAEI